MLVASSALSFVVSFVKIIIERSLVPQVPFKKFSTVGRGERPVRNEVYEIVMRFSCAEVLLTLRYSLYGFLVMKYSLEKKNMAIIGLRLKKSRLRSAYRASSYGQRNWLCGSHLGLTTMNSVMFKILNSRLH